MAENDVLLSFKGEITPTLLDSLLEVAESKIDKLQEEPKIKKKIFNVLVECLQNLYHHSDLLIEEGDKYDPKTIMILIGKKNGEYYVSTGNYILSEKVNSLKNKIDKINGLSKEELKSLYQEVLNNNEFSEKGGGGLGIIDIARKSGKRLEYNFESINNNYSFFGLEVKIS